MCCMVLEALGGSFTCILSVQEVPGGPHSSFGRVLLAVEALGGSSVRILRVQEAPGAVGCLTALSQPNPPGGSAKEDPHACGGEREGGGEGSGRGWEVQI